MANNRLKEEVKEIMLDLDTDCLTIDCCDFHKGNDLLTHCYNRNGRFLYTAGDMEEDKHAVEHLLTDSEEKELLETIIECYD